MDDADSISAQIAQVERSKTEREEQNAQREQASMSKHALAFASQIRLQQLPRAHLENLPTADIEQLARIVKKLERRLANDCESNDSALSRIRELLKTKNYSHNERLSERFEHLGFFHNRYQEGLISTNKALRKRGERLQARVEDLEQRLEIQTQRSDAAKLGVPTEPTSTELVYEMEPEQQQGTASEAPATEEPEIDSQPGSPELDRSPEPDRSPEQDRIAELSEQVEVLKEQLEQACQAPGYHQGVVDEFRRQFQAFESMRDSQLAALARLNDRFTYRQPLAWRVESLVSEVISLRRQQQDWVETSDRLRATTQRL